MSDFFIIVFGEDGISITPANKKDVQNLVNDRVEDDEPFVTEVTKFYMDGGEYPIHKTMIIKGKLIVPKPVEIVKKYEIE